MSRVKALVATAPFMMLARVAGAGAGFLAQLVLARLLTPEALGKFFAATSLAAVLGVAATQGYPGIIQRFVSRYRRSRQAALLGAFFGQVQRETWLAGLFFAALLLVPAILLPALDSDWRIFLTATAICVGAATSFSLYPPLACAGRMFAVGLLPETLVRPTLFLGVAVAVGLSGVTLSAGMAVAAYAAVSASLALVQFVVLKSAFASHGFRAPKKLRRRWRQEAWPLLLVLLFTTLFADLVILLTSPFLGAEALAPFGIALKISMLIGFIVQVTHQISLPDLADAHQGENTEEMLDALLRSTLLPVLVTGAALVAAIFWGDQILRLFGPGYAAAKWGLVILIAAQLIRALAGPAPMLLTLGGQQGTNAAITLACCGVLLAGNAVLTPSLGLLGACLSVVLVAVAWTGLSAAMLAWRMKTGASLLFVLRHVPAKKFAGRELLALIGKRRSSLPEPSIGGIGESL
ncbi:MAG TPA: oligosaccharide flippase family protein [Xanthobacteraceae bacterium]|nr:oligosaccharide flippase family protein [Xanthobacteraceae bacterium]